ncbi:MAG: hypothetical protein F3741_11140 [Nitrospinae bacterium]|nr:hypothetical protein [Nitrospinota bacterium]
MKQNQTIKKNYNKIITLLLLCFVAVMMTRGNLVPWSFESDRGISQTKSFEKLLKAEKRSFDSKNVFAFDPEWENVSPFIKGRDGFSLRVNIGGKTRIVFPPFLNSRSPIKIRTRNKTVKQYLISEGTYRGELVGRYLVYKGKGKDILYRYDTDSNQLREFVYLPRKDSLNTDGEVIRWRFVGVNLSLEDNDDVRLIDSRNPSAELSKISDNGLQTRISRFLKKRNQQLNKGTIEKTLFVIPRPEYVDGNLETLTRGIHYQVSNNELKLMINLDMDFDFPLWVDPSLRADADADVILDGQSAGDSFGFSVASAGDFNGDGIDDIIVGAWNDDNSSASDSGSAFIFFGGVNGTKRADADADVILNGQSAGDSFGVSVASAGDFNGDGKDDVIIGAPLDDNNFSSNSGSAFIFFGGISGTKRADADADVILNGQSAGDEFGHSVASSGDFNDDGKDDVIIGAHKDDNNSASDSGSAFIFFGGITGTKRADADANIILNGQSAGDEFGRDVASAGDFNGDGKSDVIVGARLDDNNSTSNSGSAFIFFGGFTGTKRADADADVILNGQSDDDRFGGLVSSAGDFNGDGKGDVIIGAPADDNNAQSDSGSAFIFYGGITGTKRSDADADVILDGQSAGDGFATSFEGSTGFHSQPIAAGDFNGDGTSDVIVGAYLDDNNSATDSGSAFIFFGSGISFSIIHAANTRDSTRLAISPYAQAVPNESYTFIGVSHPSLDTASTEIGAVLEVIGMTTTVNNAAGRAIVFTIGAGETHRFFVVNQSHPSINSLNKEFQSSINSNAHLIPTVDSAQFGSIRVTTLDPNPNTAVVVNSKNTYKNLAQLSMWGVIYHEATGAGFTMEFIGDMQDSSVGGDIHDLITAGRGIN